MQDWQMHVLTWERQRFAFLRHLYEVDKLNGDEGVDEIPVAEALGLSPGQRDRIVMQLWQSGLLRPTAPGRWVVTPKGLRDVKLAVQQLEHARPSDPPQPGAA